MLARMSWLLLSILCLAPNAAEAKKPKGTPSAEPAAQAFKDGAAYNDWIVAQQDKIGAATLAMGNALGGGDVEAAERARAELERVCLAVVEETKALPPYEQNRELRDAALALFQFYLRTATDGYPAILVDYRVIISTKDPATIDAAAARATAVADRVAAEEAPLDQRFAEVQSAFAAKHGFTLTENTLQKEFDGAKAPTRP